MALPEQPNHNIIRLNVRCPSCAQPYDWQRLKIIGEHDQQLLAYIDCAICSTALISILSMGQTGMTAQGTVTDLTFEEVADQRHEEVISMDDALDLHEFLSNHDRLFGRP